MENFNIHAAKTHLSKLIDKVEHGEEVIISKAGKPVAKIVPYAETQAPKQPRQFGQWTGKVWISPDFDAPDPALEKLFNEGPLFPDTKK